MPEKYICRVGPRDYHCEKLSDTLLNVVYKKKFNSPKNYYSSWYFRLFYERYSVKTLWELEKLDELGMIAYVDIDVLFILKDTLFLVRKKNEYRKLIFRLVLFLT